MNLAPSRRRVLTLLGLLAVSACSVVTSSNARAGRIRRLPSDHFDGKVFFNPHLPPGSLPRFRDVVRMLREERAPWPTWVENRATPALPDRLDVDEIALTFVNHATFLIQINGLNILTDPVWSERVSPVSWAGPKRVRAPGLRFDDLPRIDCVLVSHNHYDHLDVETLRRLNRRFGPKVVAPIGDRPLLTSIGCRNVIELDWWESVDLAPETRVAFAPAQHQSNRGLFDRATSLWGSYMIQSGTRRIYFGGDSGYAPHFVEIGQQLGPPDVALLGMGAYEPRWFMQPIHMNPAEAVAAHRDLGSRLSVGMHFGTFQLSAEGIGQPRADLATALEATGVSAAEFITLNEGETRLLA